jgi:hypothetical protein
MTDTTTAPAGPPTGVEPIVATAGVHRPRPEAFELFTEHIAEWWPMRGHSVGADAADVVLEPRAGGRVYERTTSGEEREWGRIVTWEPPERLAVSWFPGREPGQATEWECVFEEVNALTTRLRLTHHGWERLADGAEARGEMEAGWWPRVMAAFGEWAADPACTRYFAIETNQRTWRLLGLGDERTAEETEDMVHAAHTSAWHWRRIGTPVNDARGEWLCSHVYAVIGRAEPAAHHAERSLAVCQENGIGDFDLSYAYEGVARAAACAGDVARAREYAALAADAANAIAEAEDREYFENDLAAEPWYGALAATVSG